jgi:hypothetical protein
VIGYQHPEKTQADRVWHAVAGTRVGGMVDTVARTRVSPGGSQRAKGVRDSSHRVLQEHFHLEPFLS